MDPALASLYEKVKDRLPRDEFERRVKEASAEFGGLLDDEAIGLLVLDELGLNDGAYATLVELAGRSEATVRVKVERVEPTRTFERSGRDPGRVANVVVSDATGEARLVFWDKDVDRVEELRPGVHLTVVNARVKPSSYGNELHIGPWSVLDVEGALDPARRKLLADVADAGEKGAPVQSKLQLEELPTTLEGKLAWLSATRPYRTKEGGTGFACDADIETADGLRRLVAWDAAVKGVRSVAPGARVRVEGLAPKVKGAATEWHTTPQTRFAPL
jgi:ssDNA-binding replication factor A large subunit